MSLEGLKLGFGRLTGMVVGGFMIFGKLDTGLPRFGPLAIAENCLSQRLLFLVAFLDFSKLIVNIIFADDVAAASLMICRYMPAKLLSKLVDGLSSV
ncbi:unnamed protein product [Cylicostephanus goldi]|uniref:Uncharacterized protein n=1 Tax=Cylicostephanus goldi TaxID=71465 RepID=A0A3P7LUM5_CYLGO|nr:unnamed protein product [Cylicostephanus goldi]